MKIMREIWARIRYLFREESHARDLSEELDAHLQMEIDAKIEWGMSPDQARDAARREFGSPARLRESSHAAWAFHWLESILQDFRYSLRQVRKAPGLSLAVVASLAIGLGANTAIFSLIDAAVLRPLPVRDPDQLVQLEWQNDAVPANVFLLCSSMSGARNAQARDSASGGGRVQMPCVSEPVFRALTKRQTGFMSLIGTGPSPVGGIAISTSAGAPASQVLSQPVSWNFFEALGVPVALGRPFVEEDDRLGAELTVVVSHRFWSSRLGGDPGAIGRFVRINNKPARIVGVAPPGFFGLTAGTWIDVYQPLAGLFGDMSRQSPGLMASTFHVDLLARLAPGVSGAAGASGMSPLFRGLMAETRGKEIEEKLELVARPAARGLYTGSAEEVAQALWILMLLVGVLLLIVCANVANLLLSRSVKRRPESALRLALGAGRGRLVRQHLVETGMLACIGGAAGLVLGSLLARWIHTVFQTGQGPWAAFAITLDWRVSAYALAISALTAVIFGLAPAWTAVHSELSDTLKIQSRSVLGGGVRLPKLLVSVQFALSFTALVAAGLLGRSMGNLYATDLGFDGEQLSFATIHPSQAGYQLATIGSYRQRLQREIEAIPGVLAVAQLVTRPLEAETPLLVSIDVPDGPPTQLADGMKNPAALAYASAGGPGFIDVLGVHLVAGRTLEPHEGCALGQRSGVPAAPSAPCPVVIDQRFADVFFPGKTAVGQFFKSAGRSYQVVGLVANARVGSLRSEARPTMYQQLDLSAMSVPADHLAIRAKIDSGALAIAVREAVARIDPSVPLAEFHTQSGLVDRQLRTERLLALVSGAFSLAALALAAVGLAGLLGYAVARRTNEIGIRMALGATGTQVRHMVLGDSIRMVGAGILVGVPASWAVGRFLKSRLFGLEPMDPTTALLALLALIVIAGVAALLPARRAARVSPLTALREE
jgi:predicted permease